MMDEMEHDDGETAASPGSKEVSVTDELTAMRKLHTALQPLDRAAQVRVLTWLADRYGVHDGGVS